MIFEAFENIKYMDTESVDLIRDYHEYIDRTVKKFRLGTYTITSGDRPDLVAYKLYGNPKLFWVLLYINDITDPFHGWKKDTNAVYESATQKYSDMGGTKQVAYYRSSDGEKFYDLFESEDNPLHWYHIGDIYERHIQYLGVLSPVPVHVAELEINDEIQTIKVVNPEEMRSFLEELQREVSKVNGSIKK